MSSSAFRRVVWVGPAVLCAALATLAMWYLATLRSEAVERAARLGAARGAEPMQRSAHLEKTKPASAEGDPVTAGTTTPRAAAMNTATTNEARAHQPAIDGASVDEAADPATADSIAIEVGSDIPIGRLRSGAPAATVPVPPAREFPLSDVESRDTRR